MILVLFLFFFINPLKAHQSFFFSEQEVQNIEKKFNATEWDQITLNGILYVNPQSWVVWVNGVSIEKGKNPCHGLTVHRVFPTEIHGFWHLEGKSYPIKLSLNQTEKRPEVHL